MRFFFDVRLLYTQLINYRALKEVNIIMNIEQIKAIYTCLDYPGTPLRKTSSGWYLYRCPWKEDRKPSLNVSPNGKVWMDKSTGKEGGIIELVQTCLNTKDFKVVCAEFDSSSFSMSKTLDYKKEKDIECSRFASFSVMPLQSRGLYAYLTKRRINTSIARQFLQEAHYSFQERTDGRYLYALAYQNDKGGYELRGAPYIGNLDGYKGGTSPKGITTHFDREDAPTVVFEGFMDMLSFATLCGSVKHNYVVLNSTAMVASAIEVLKPLRNQIYLCLDNDKSGNDATRQLMDALPEAKDIREKFAPAKDVNDYLCHR